MSFRPLRRCYTAQSTISNAFTYHIDVCCFGGLTDRTAEKTCVRSHGRDGEGKEEACGGANTPALAQVGGEAGRQHAAL